MKVSFVLSFFLCFSLLSFADAGSYEGHDKRILSKVIVKGLEKTDRSIVINEMDVKVGQPLTAVDLQESYNRLFNLRIFSKVELSLEKIENQESILTVTVSERWTLIPIAKVLSGGGSTQFTLGVFDINVFGEFIELGAQYETLNGSPGFVHWFRNPRLFGKRLRVGYDIWNVTRNRLLFTSSVPSGETAETIGGYTVNRQRYNFFIDKEFIYWFNLGAGFDISKNTADDSELSEDLISSNASNGFAIPEQLDEHAYYAYFRLGRLNFQNYLVEGIQTDWNFRFADSGLGGNETSHRFTKTTKAFLLLPYEQNIGVNFTLGHTNSEKFQNNFFVGGLDNVRGFQDGQFFGKNFWQANAEYRISSFRSHWFVLQHNFFYDVGNVSDELHTLFSNNPRDAFHSVGTGVRLISPSIFRFNLRIDFAKGINYNQPTNISFGLQQFF